MNDSIIRFYMFANILKNKLRAGWIQIGINKQRTESIADHIYGTLVLAISINSEYKLDLDMLKVLKTLALHELEEILMPDFTIRSDITKKEKDEKGKICVSEVTKGLFDQEEIERLLVEFSERSTKEAKFCYLVDKIECDFQAKMYDLEGNFDIEDAKEDLKFYGDEAKNIEQNAKCASDYWILYDKKLYEHNEIFKSLLEDIRNIDKNSYQKVIDIKENFKG